MITKNSIPTGYKDSAVGIIPQEWCVFDFGDIAYVSKEKYTPTKSSHIACVELEHLSQGDGVLLGYTEAGLQKSTKNIFKKGCILFGKLRPYLRKYWLAPFDGVCSSEIWVLNSNEEVCAKEYLYRLISSERFIQFANVSIGSKMPRADWNFVSLTPFAVPPIAEQRKIAEILGVWDEAIEKQSRLIEKLELRKRALMQRFLTGRIRLPGFTTPWQKVKLGEIFDERNETKCENLPLLSITADKGVILQSESDKKDTSNEDKSKYKRICPNDIGYNTMRMWQGRSALSTMEGIVSPAYTIVTPKAEVDSLFISELIKQPRVVYDFWTHSQGLVGDTLNCKFHDFSQVKVAIPSLPEQKAIAEVLTTADDEIATHCKKLDALRLQKRGLMQQLLTGKTRVKI